MSGLEGEGLPMTALAVAAGRAVEATRADALVADPFAAVLVALLSRTSTCPWPGRGPGCGKVAEVLPAMPLLQASRAVVTSIFPTWVPASR